MNIAILLRNSLDFSQLGYNASTQINSYIKNNPDDKLITCCLSNTPPTFKANTANVSITDLNLFDGLVISTCIETTLFAKGLVKDNDIIHYVWDLEWLRAGKKDYFQNIAAYRNVILATRSNMYAVELFKYSGIATKLITPNFNIQYLADAYKQSK